MFAFEVYIIFYITLAALPAYKISVYSKNVQNNVFYSHCAVSFGALAYCYQAIETLKTFEKKDTRAKSTAGTNLSFLYFLVRCSHQLS